MALNRVRIHLYIVLPFPLSQLEVRAYGAIDIAPIYRVMCRVLFRRHVMQCGFQVLPPRQVLSFDLAYMAAWVPLFADGPV